MTLRRLKIASLRFSRPGESLRSDQESSRLKHLVNDLIAFCPRAGCLVSSVLDWSKIDHPQGAILEYWLEESPQRNLPISVPKTAKHQSTDNDAFVNDVVQLTQEIQAAQGFFLVAVEPTYTPEQLRAPDVFAARRRKIRTRVKHRQLLQIPTVEGSGITVPKGGHLHLPQARRANVIASVHSSIRRATKLNDAQFIGEPPSDLAGQSIPNQVLLHRPDSAKDLRLMRILDRAMDGNKKVKLQVLINLDWVDGSIESLTFHGIYKRSYKARDHGDIET